MATKAEQFKSEQQRAQPPLAKTPPKGTRLERAAAGEATRKSYPPTKSMRGSEHAQQMKSSTASSRQGRRGG
jgi:hypothetical protein